MAEITAQMVKELRVKTDAGMMDCKKALIECDGDMDAAVKYLREKGIAKAAKKADREAKEGVVTTIVEGNDGIIFEINCETDFCSKGDKFRNLVAEIGAALKASDAKTLEDALNVETPRLWRTLSTLPSTARRLRSTSLSSAPPSVRT